MLECEGVFSLDLKAESITKLLELRLEFFMRDRGDAYEAFE